MQSLNNTTDGCALQPQTTRAASRGASAQSLLWNRKHDLRVVFNALRRLVRSSAHWRMMPHEFPPWPAVYQQMRRWVEAGCFEAMVQDLRGLLREYAGRKGRPSAVILDSHTLQSTPESGARQSAALSQAPSWFLQSGVDSFSTFFDVVVPLSTLLRAAQARCNAHNVRRAAGWPAC